MVGVGIGGLIGLVVSVFLGLGVVVGWIIKSEMSHNTFKAQIQKLKGQLDAAEREKVMMIEEMHTLGSGASAQGSPDSGPGNAMIAKMIERVEELEKDNTRLKQELNEAKSSLEEVYKALCSK